MVKRYWITSNSQSGLVINETDSNEPWLKDVIWVKHADHEAALAKKDAEIARYKTIARQFERDWLEACNQVDTLQAAIDHVMGEAVKFALAVNAADREIPVTYRRQATSILQLPEVQSWRARQGKEAKP